jgi:hypothetical protein
VVIALNACLAWKRTATGLAQDSWQQTNVLCKIAETPINMPNNRTHQDAL